MILQDDTGIQIAALPLRLDSKGDLSVLMVTSRETKRWVMPKGWRINAAKPWETAKVEALEEAGALGHVSNEPLGVYHYDKRLEGRQSVACRVTVYPMMVDKLKSNWKERDQRKRRWFGLCHAARLVEEPELAALLNALNRRPKSHVATQELLDEAR